MDEIIEMIDICVDARCRRIEVSGQLWETLRDWYEDQDLDKYTDRPYGRYKFYRIGVKTFQFCSQRQFLGVLQHKLERE